MHADRWKMILNKGDAFKMSVASVQHWGYVPGRTEEVGWAMGLKLCCIDS